MCFLRHLACAQEANPVEPTAKPLPDYIKLVHVVAAEPDKLVAPVDHPLYSYADSARIIAEGTIWAWGETGRPLAMAKCWKNRNGTQTVAFSLTSNELLVAGGPQNKTWRPQKTQVEPAELRGAPAPDDKEPVRLRQLKEQSRRFTAHEFWEPENSRFELRLLVQPVHRYQDEKHKILDAAVFLLAYDNNPQILLLIEIVKPDDGKPRWQYLLAQVSSADLHVSLDGKEVWQRSRTPGIVGRPTDYYWHMVTTPQSPAAP